MVWASIIVCGKPGVLNVRRSQPSRISQPGRSARADFSSSSVRRWSADIGECSGFGVQGSGKDLKLRFVGFEAEVVGEADVVGGQFVGGGFGEVAVAEVGVEVGNAEEREEFGQDFFGEDGAL